MLSYVLWDTVNLVAGSGTSVLRSDLLYPAPDGFVWHEVEGDAGTTTLKLVDGVVTECPFSLPPELALLSAKEGKWVEARTYRDTLVQERLTSTTPQGVFDYDTKARANIQDTIRVADAMGGAAPSSMLWKLHDNTSVEVTLQDLNAADMAGIMAKNVCYTNSFRIEAEIAAASTAEQVAAIDITAGYPT